LVAENGAMRLPRATPTGSKAAELPKTVRLDTSRLDFAIPVQGRRMRVIGIVPDQLLTENLILEPAVRDGFAVADAGRDLLKMAVVERHHASGKLGLGFVRGLGLARGAIAGTVAHDHHNLVVIGADDLSMWTAMMAVAEAGGGQAVALGQEVLAVLPLPIAGLMSDHPIEEVRDQARDLLAAARKMGARLREPFMAMSFLALEVIPALKLTDKGLVDVERFEVVPLFVE
jgi:adenine deaminase